MSKPKEIAPTDPEAEVAQGRVALWLEPEHIQLIAAQSQNLPADMDEETQAAWDVIRFRANAALHKSGHKG